MENRDNQTPETGHKAEFDAAKKQAEYGQQQQGQQPTESQGQRGDDWKNAQPDPLASGSEGQSSTGQADYGSAEQSDTMTGERSDIEGSSFEKKSESGEADGFIGTQGSSDTSSELVEDDDGIPSDGE